MCVVARYPQWVPLVVCGAVYGTAFAFPATLDTSGDEGLCGHCAFTLAWGFRDYRWLANPAAWLAALLLAWRLWPWAALLALTGFGVAVSSAVRVGLGEWNSTHGLGYWLWCGSMGLLFVASLVGWFGAVPRERRRSPVEVFRGWRGVAVGSWILFGLGVLAFGWYFDDIYPPYTRPGNMDRAQTVSYAVGGVAFEFEYRPGTGAAFGRSDRSLSGTVGPHSVRFWNGELTINDIDYGNLKPGDALRLPIDGKPLLNGRPLAPFPIRPVRLTTPPRFAPKTDAEVHGLAWRPDGSLVALTGGRTVQVWDVTRPDAPRTTVRLPDLGVPQFLALSPNGRRVAIGDQKGDVFLWDIGDAEPVRLPGSKARLGAVAFLTDDWLAEGRGPELLARHLVEDRAATVRLGPMREYNPRSVAISGDGKTIARLVKDDRLEIDRVAFEGGTVVVTPGVRLTRFDYDAAPVLNRDGSLVFARADARGENDLAGLVVVETATGRMVSRLKWRATPGMVTQLQAGSFSPDSKLLALGEIESVRVYDVATGRERAWVGAPTRSNFNDPHDGELGWVHALGFSPDGQRLAIGTGTGRLPALTVWETKAFSQAGER